MVASLRRRVSLTPIFINLRLPTSRSLKRSRRMTTAITPAFPPANPAKAAVRLQDAIFTTASVRAISSLSPVSIEVADSTGFVVGLQVVIDVEDDGHIQESVRITDIPDASHIVVESLTHTHDGRQIPFPMLQPGDKGTHCRVERIYPSSGIDIAVTSNLATIV